MREWLIALGILVVVALLLDGLRRMRNARRDSLQMSLAMQRGIDRTDDDYGNDFPSGPARVVAQRTAGQDDDEPELHDDEPEVALADTSRRRNIDFSQTAPMLLDVRDDKPQRIEPDLGDDEQGDDLDAVVDEDSAADEAEADARDMNAVSPVFDTATTPLGLGESDVIGKPRVYERPADKLPPRREAPPMKPVKPVIKAKEERAQAQQQQAQTEQPSQQQALFDYIGMSVMARDRGGFAGAALLEALLAQGLRYGHRNIFHRYTGEESEQESLYSVANVVKPGTFDLGNMESFQSPGIMLFLPLQTPGQTMEAFESMLATARAVAEQLNGDLRDSDRNVMTQQTIEHYRQRIRDFEMQSRLRAR